MTCENGGIKKLQSGAEISILMGIIYLALPPSPVGTRSDSGDCGEFAELRIRRVI